MLKERRKLVAVTRETPLSLIHIRNLETVTLAGATVLRPTPAFYHQPKTIDDLLNQTKHTTSALRQGNFEAIKAYSE
jgi:3-polyprenyl-4-hydroxybenzoate decarboxylase